MKITILASIGCQNLGDELILKNEILLFEEKFKKQKIYFNVFSYNSKNPFFKKENIKYLEYFPINIKKISNLFRNIKNFYLFVITIILSDLVVIGGGGLFYDKEIQSNSMPLKLWLFRARIIKFFGKKLIFYGVSIDIKYKKNLSLIKKIFSLADEIYLRDKHSSGILKSLGIKSKIILDPVFYDNKKEIENSKKKFCLKKFNSESFKISYLKNIDFYGKRVGVALRRGYFTIGGNKIKTQEKTEVSKVIEILKIIIDSGAKSILLLAHSFHEFDLLANDYNFYLVIQEELEKRGKKKLLRYIKICNCIEEVYNVYKNKKIDICISERYHSMILSQVYKIPFIGFSYGHKTDELLKTKKNDFSYKRNIL